MGEARRRGSREERLQEAIKKYEESKKVEEVEETKKIEELKRRNKTLKSYLPILGFALTKKRFQL